MVSTRSDPYDRPLTHRDLDHTPDDGNRYEIIDGVLHVTPFPTAAHVQGIAGGNSGWITTPEPTAIALLAIAGTILLRRRNAHP